MVTAADSPVSANPAEPIAPAPTVAPESIVPAPETPPAPPPTAEVAAPVTPTPTPATPPPPTPPTAEAQVRQELDSLRQEMAQERAQLAQREAVAREKEDWAALQSAQAQLIKELQEQEALTPERATAIAQRQMGAIWQAYQAQQQFHAEAAGARAKQQVAVHFSQQYGIPITELLQYNTPEAMQAAGERMKTQNAQATKIAQLEAQVAKLTKGTVTAQSFSQGVTGGDGSTATPDNIDALYLKDPERYGPAYRKFLASR